MNETALVKLVLLNFKQDRAFCLFRQNTGALQTKQGGFVRFGLCPGSSDIIGWKALGEVARFVAIECKVGSNKLTDYQRGFLLSVHEAGGLAYVARPDDSNFKGYELTQEFLP